MNDPLQTQDRPGAARPHAGDSLNTIVQDVEQFARGWIGRVRKILQRSSQLIERESLLAGAIAKLDQQKSDWLKRTREKEAALLEQSKMLSEAWLDVEAQRRKAAQGVRASQAAGVGRVARSAGAPPVVAPVSVVEPTTEAASPSESSVAPPVISNPPVAPVGNTPTDSVANVPVNTMNQATNTNSGDVDQEAAARERIDEFKRMQRALRSNRNR